MISDFSEGKVFSNLDEIELFGKKYRQFFFDNEFKYLEATYSPLAPRLDADIQKLLCYQNFHFGGLSFLVAAKTTQ
jgi:hypothetical protein